MSAVYDSWERLIRAVLSREDLRRSGMRTPSEMSSLSARSSFSSISPIDYSVNSSSFTYDQIFRATDSLSSSRLIFSGVSGDFYHGVLEEGGVPVLVKKVYSSHLSFLKSEMDFFAKVSHPNFVPLVGYCMENRDYKFVVYEHMENGDLFSSLYNNRGIAADGRSQPLDWKSRLKIAIGVAQALCHLHHECVPPLVHRYVEASSILIDESYDGHLGMVFEVCKEKESRKQSMISKLFRPSKSSERGTSSDSSNATRAYDVYCFGKVLLQLVTGIPVLCDLNNSLAPNTMNYILPYITTYDEELFVDIVDPFLTIDRQLLNEIWEVTVVAKACLSSNPSERPLMKTVLEALDDSILGQFLSLAGSASSDQFTQTVPSLAETKLPVEFKLAGTSQATVSGIFADRGVALWNSQDSPSDAAPSLVVFNCSQLQAATRNFSSDCLLGEGRYGKVYRGCLPIKYASDSHRLSLITTAVKRLESWVTEGDVFQQWWNEIEILGRFPHQNLIKLHGYCFEDKELILVYEYMSNRSLKNRLFGGDSVMFPLSWDIRLKVLTGVARGLAFLHALERPIIFRDLTTSSILLDDAYNPKISDFCLASVGNLENGQHVSTTHVVGTHGYAAPEYIETGRLYVKSDVYSFGVVMVEVLTGLRALDHNRPSGQHNLVDWIKPRLSDQRQQKNIMDPRLKGEYSVKGAFRMARLALTCLSAHPNDRPSMEQVMETLLGIESFLESKRT